MDTNEKACRSRLKSLFSFWKSGCGEPQPPLPNNSKIATETPQSSSLGNTVPTFSLSDIVAQNPSNLLAFPAVKSAALHTLLLHPLRTIDIGECLRGDTDPTTARVKNDNIRVTTLP